MDSVVHFEMRHEDRVRMSLYEDMSGSAVTQRAASAAKRTNHYENSTLAFICSISRTTS